MFSGYGWCVLRSSREAYRDVSASDVDTIDAAVDAADRALWAAFNDWCAENPHPMFRTYFHETINFQNGILMFCISRNHRAAPVWDMLQWIAQSGPGSYGLFYAHDDEDAHDLEHDAKRYSRFAPPINYDFTNVFRVHRIANGTVTENGRSILWSNYPQYRPATSLRRGRLTQWSASANMVFFTE